MGKKIVISFPGGRGYEIPLLYFSSKHFEDLGYEKLFINHPNSGEIRDVLNAIMQLIIYYDIEEDVNRAIETSISRLTAEGHI